MNDQKNAAPPVTLNPKEAAKATMGDMRISPKVRLSTEKPAKSTIGDFRIAPHVRRHA